jgi:diguanylate cyclase (GGDEF)-like protein
VTGLAAELKAAAFDAAGAGLEIRDGAGRRVLANAANGAGAGTLQGEARCERLVEGRAKLVEARNFVLDGQNFSVVATVDVDAQRRLQDDLFARAYFDASTGLPNRELCDRAIADMIAARADAAPFAVVHVRIDKAPEIVAFHGAEAGEMLAARIGERLARETTPEDLVARVGSDEFCLLLAAPGGPSEALATCQRLATRASEPCLVDGVEIFPSASAGACYWPAGDAGAEGLRRKAKAAARGCSRRRSSFASASARGRTMRCGRRSATAASAAPSSPRSISAPARSTRWRC